MIQKCHTAGFGEFSYLSDLEKYNWSLLINCVWPFTAYKSMFVNLTCEISAAPDHFLHDIHHVIDLCDSRLHNSINSCTKHEVQQVQQGTGPWLLTYYHLKCPTVNRHPSILHPFTRPSSHNIKRSYGKSSVKLYLCISPFSVSRFLQSDTSGFLPFFPHSSTNSFMRTAFYNFFSS